MEHIGSTAVADLAAKPSIDVLVTVRDLEQTPTPEVDRYIAFRDELRRSAEDRDALRTSRRPGKAGVAGPPLLGRRVKILAWSGEEADHGATRRILAVRWHSHREPEEVYVVVAGSGRGESDAEGGEREGL